MGKIFGNEIGQFNFERYRFMAEIWDDKISRFFGSSEDGILWVVFRRNEFSKNGLNER